MNRVEDEKLKQTATESWHSGLVFGIQSGFWQMHVTDYCLRNDHHPHYNNDDA